MARRLKSANKKIYRDPAYKAAIDKHIAEAIRRIEENRHAKGATAQAEVVKEPEKKLPTEVEKKLSEDYLRELANAPRPEYKEDDDEDGYY